MIYTLGIDLYDNSANYIHQFVIGIISQEVSISYDVQNKILSITTPDAISSSEFVSLSSFSSYGVRIDDN